MSSSAGAQGTLPPISPADALRRFLRVGAGRKFVLVEAGAYLLYARLLTATAPFARIARLLGTADVPPALAVTDMQVARARQVGSAVRRVARAVPFRAVCLQQVIAARLMCRRRGLSTVATFGVAEAPEGGLRHHAWLKVGDEAIVGGRDLDAYAVLTRLH